MVVGCVVEPGFSVTVLIIVVLLTWVLWEAYSLGNDLFKARILCLNVWIGWLLIFLRDSDTLMLVLK